MIDTILFDLDNTLARCMVYFDFMKKNTYKILSNETGLSVSEIEAIFNVIESDQMRSKEAFSKKSHLEAINKARTVIHARLLDSDDGVAKAAKFYESDTSFKLLSLTSKVYEAPYTIYDDAIKALDQLKAAGYSLYVVTKGDFYGQSRKAANLPQVFTGLFVLPRKNTDTWSGVLTAIQADKKSTIVVGDSVHDDINPALEIGLQAIRVNRLNTNWIGDPCQSPIRDIIEIPNLNDLLTIVTTINEADYLPF
jgi:FMN phosphatase YigB (HAD superfamily)